MRREMLAAPRSDQQTGCDARCSRRPGRIDMQGVAATRAHTDLARDLPVTSRAQAAQDVVGGVGERSAYDPIRIRPASRHAIALASPTVAAGREATREASHAGGRWREKSYPKAPLAVMAQCRVRAQLLPPEELSRWRARVP